MRKIATHSLTPTLDDWFGSSPANSHWEVLPWDATVSGQSVTEGGSSGSPLYNANGRVIGQLHGGSSINCSTPSADPGIYGAVAYSWTNGGATDNRRKLQPWLDPDATGATVLDGTYGSGAATCFSPGGLSSSLAGSNVNLSWSAVTSALSYNVRYRQSGTGTWTNTSTASTSTTIGGLVSCVEYEWQVQTVCDTSSSSFTVSATFISPGCPCPVYCTSGGGTVDEWIDAITIGSLVNSSGDNGGYINYTGTSFTATYDPGSTYSVSLTPGYTSTIYAEWFHVYIDYNQDGDFDDAGELAYDAGAAVSGVPATGSLTIPGSATPGQTGMRVIMRYFSAPTPCGTWTYAETEDYCITISGGGCSTATTPQNPMSSVGPTSTTLSWDAVTGSVACQIEGTRTSPAGPTGYKNVVGAEPTSTTVPHTVTGAGTTWDWRVRCACSLSPVTATGFSTTNSFSVPAPRYGATLTDARLFPNPADQSVRVEFTTEAAGTAIIRVTNALGQLISATEVATTAGANATDLGTADWPVGHYLVQVVAGGTLATEHLTIER